MNSNLRRIQNQIDDFKKRNPEESVGELSDTYHSFDDLYKHRTVLTALAFIYIPYAWKSKIHDDGSMYDGMFIVGAPTPTGMISYHYDIEYWNIFKIPELPHAPKFTGYTDNDVLTRIEDFIISSNTRLVNSTNIESIEDIVKNEIIPTFGDDVISQASFISFYNHV